ncbi:MAG TPA: NAD(P)-dependent oxidoreductase [Candidatus Binataceae bacterium]|nr:NAD(P)-dependent oxidoreductase [Candidatus Binataceae bacterium]
MRIGFIGLGNMGGPMALNLIKAGHSLAVHDLRRDMAQAHLAGGAQWADSPAEAARGREVVFTSLPGPREVEAVALGRNGIIDGIERGAIYADLSTSSPTLIRRIHAALAEKGVAVLDTPVSGGPPGARNATLSVMAGGDEGDYLRLKPALEAIGDKLQYVGEVGAGEVAKIVHNMMIFCTISLFAEAFTMGIKAGVDPQKLYTAVRNGAYGQGMMLAMLPATVFKGRFDVSSGTINIVHKDIALATEVARKASVPMRMAALVEQDLLEAIARGLGEKDLAAAFTVQEERAGVKVRS